MFWSQWDKGELTRPMLYITRPHVNKKFLKLETSAYMFALTSIRPLRSLLKEVLVSDLFKTSLAQSAWLDLCRGCLSEVRLGAGALSRGFTKLG